MLGGNSVGGGRGSVGKALMGAIIVSLLTNGLVRLGLENGASSLAIGLVLIIAIAIDVRWSKWRHRLRAKVYVSPAYLALPPPPDFASGSASPYAINDRLNEVEIIGLGEIDGPEDVILDEDGHLYCGVRHGEIIRFLAPDYSKREVYAHVGGRPLGLAFDREGGLNVCIAGMGLYRVDRDRNVKKLTAETNRSPFSIIDDFRMRLADDLDIGPDGRIYFSEATIRYGFEEWVVDALEGRGNGRIIRYDPATGTTRTILRNLLFANGICVAHDNNSVLFAETWGCRVSRYWLDGPNAGTIETVISDLPGYPDNINRGSNGTYWVALAGTRTPSYDLAMTMPGFRRRMARWVAADEWLFPNVNVGCVVHFDANGRVLETLWDLDRRKPSCDHLDARASRLSLSRRRHQQPDRPDQTSRRRSQLDEPRLLLGSRSVKPIDKSFGPVVRPRRSLDHRCRRWTARSGPTISSTPPRSLSKRRRPTRWPSPRAAWWFRSGDRSSASTGPRMGRPRASTAEISALTGLPDGGAAAGLVDGRIVFVGGRNDGRTIAGAAMHDRAGAGAGRRAAHRQRLGGLSDRPIGSATSWRRSASGSVWRLDPRQRRAHPNRRRSRLSLRPPR